VNATEVSATPVAQVPDASNWNGFVSSDPDSVSAALQKVNNNFNQNSLSKNVVDQGLTQAGAQLQQGFQVIDDASATGFASTNSNTGDYAGAVQQFNSDSNNIGVASVKPYLPGNDYLDAATADYSRWQQILQNAAGKAKSTFQSWYNNLTGAPTCNLFTTDPECAK
jgi:hypothetical protein